MNKQFKFSSQQHPFAREKYKLFTQIYKKGVGVCFYAHPGTTGLRIASPHRIDNAVSPRQYELYKFRYIETHYVDDSLSSACCDG